MTVLYIPRINKTIIMHEPREKGVKDWQPHCMGIDDAHLIKKFMPKRYLQMFLKLFKEFKYFYLSNNYIDIKIICLMFSSIKSIYGY